VSRKHFVHNIAVLVVHGVGAQEPGETLGKLLGGLKRVGRTSLSEETRDGAVGMVGGQETAWPKQ
jgi:hypothetical protein